MATERTTDLILRAQVDQALQPLSQVTQRVKELITVLDAQRTAAQNGDTTLGEYAKALRDVEKASGDLLKQRAALDNFATRGQKVDTQQNVVDQRQSRRDDFASKLSTEPTDRETAALGKLDKALASSQSRLETITIAYQRSADQLVRLGVLTEDLAANQQRLRLDAANAALSDTTLLASQSLAAARAQSDTLQATLRNAAVEKQVASQRASDTARFLADQERERKAVEDLAAATRANGEAAQHAVNTAGFNDALQSGRGISRSDIEAAFEADDAAKQSAKERQQAEAALADQRARDARVQQADQERLAKAEEAASEKLRASVAKDQAAFEAFRATVEKVAARVAELHASASGAAGVAAAPGTVPATSLAENVRTALAGGPGAGVGIGDLGGLQSKIAALQLVMATASSGTAAYTQGLKELDAVSREVVRQSQIVDSFQRQKVAASEAVQAVSDALAELQRLGEQAARASTDAEVSEVTSAINAQKRKIGSLSEGSGLLGGARAQQDALAIETAALEKIGITADHVGDAMHDLTSVAVQTSTVRANALKAERADLSATADEILKRTSTLATAPVASAATTRSAVQAVGGAGRSPVIEDTGEGIDALDKKITGAKLTAQGFNRTMDELFGLQRQIGSDATLIDQFNAQAAATARAAAAFTAAQEELNRLAAEAKSGTVTLTDLRRAEASLTGAAADLQKQASAQAQLDAQLKTRKIDTTNLVVETDKLVASSQRLAAIQSRAQQSSGGLFGLSAYQVENLSYQVNDVVTQLSLGQGFLRTFESQAGQIFQVFETSITAMQNLVLFGLPAVAVIGAIVLALVRLKETEDAQKDFARVLAANADGMAYQAKELTAVARTAEGLGVSFDDARAAVKSFVADGLSVGTMGQFIRTVQNMADVTGETFPDALKALSVIIKGSYADIAALNTQYNFLHADELAAIKDAFDYADASNGRNIALNAATTAFQKGRNEGLDPFSDSVRDMKLAWHEFLDAIASPTLLHAAADGLRMLRDLAKEVAADVRFLRNPLGDAPVTTATTKMADLEMRLGRINTLIEALKKGGTPDEDSSLARLTKDAAELTKQLDAARIARYNLNVPSSGSEVTSGNRPDAPLPSTFSRLPAPDSRVNSAIPPDMLAIISATAAATGVKEADLQGIYRNEASRNADGTFKTSSAGAVGAFQLEPGTFDEVVTKFKGLFDALSATLQKPISIRTDEFNALAGALYFKDQANTFGSSALGAAAYNVGPGSEDKGTGLRGILSGQKQLPPETAQYVSNFVAGQTQVGSPGNTPGLQRQPGTGNLDASRDQAAIDSLERDLGTTVDETLRGTERIISDQKRLIEFYKTKSGEIEGKFPHALDQPGPALDAFNKVIDQFANKLTNERVRQENTANNAVLQIVKSAQEQVDKANKTDPAAQRRAVDADYEGKLSQLQEQIAHGASGIVTDQATVARDALLKLRDQARDEATVASDRAIVDNTVKARDEQFASVNNDLKTGAITLQQSFDRIALIVKSFGPAIAAAVGKSNADLATQPQTAAVQQQLAKNAKAGSTGGVGIEQIDVTAEAKINDLLTARQNAVKELEDQYANGSKTRIQTDNETLAVYAKFKPAITDLTNALQAQIDVQLANGSISQETYEKISAAIQKAKNSSDDMTASQKKLATEINDSIVNNAVKAIDTITTSIGAAIAGTGSWSDVLRSVGAAFTNFAAGVLKDIATIIIKQEILNALQTSGTGTQGASFLTKLFGGSADAAASGASSLAPVVEDTTSTFLSHNGGIAGAFTQSRALNPALFINAPRMHGGGMVGLGPGEVATVLKTGEEVLTEDNPRHRNNAQMASGGTTPQAIRNVMVLDQKDLAGAMAGAHGETVVLNHIKRNGAAVRQLIGAK